MLQKSKRHLPWHKPRAELSKFEFAIAVGRHPAHRDRPRDMRVANALVYLIHGDSGITWQGQETLCELAGLTDRSQCFRSLKALEGSGAIRIRPLSDLPEEQRSQVKRDRRGKFYEIDFDWVFRTLQGDFGAVLDKPNYDAESATYFLQQNDAELATNYDAESATNNDAELAALNKKGTGKEQEGAPSCGPADDGFAALRFASSLSSLRSDLSTSVCSAPAPKRDPDGFLFEFSDRPNEPLPVPRTDAEADQAIDTVCAGFIVVGEIKLRMKNLLVNGTLTPNLAARMRGDREEAA